MFFSGSPRCNNRLVTVGDAMDQLKAFPLIYERGKNTEAEFCPREENYSAFWAKQVYDAVINCSGTPTELDFFRKTFGAMGPTKQLDASDLYIDYNCDIDYNIYAAAAANGVVPGGPATFTLLRANHDDSGNYSNMSVNGMLYIYEDHQWVRITAVDKTTPYAHTATVVPLSGDYTVNIRKAKPMMFTSVRYVDGYACSVPSETWMTRGYVKKVQPIILRKDWEQPIELSRPYRDLLQFAILFDHEGNEIDGWVPAVRMKTAEEMKYAENLVAFMGQKISNPALIGAGLSLETDKYAGFDGYLNTMRSGGGTVYSYDTANGFSLDADFSLIIKHQDSLKRSRNFMVLHSLQFMMALNRSNANIYKDAPGQINLDVFMQMGMSKDEVAKLTMQSYTYLNFKLMFQEMSALTDSRSIGHFDMPYTAFMMPMDGVRDSKGNSKPAIEFFEPFGAQLGGYEEIGPIDHRYLADHCSKWSGYIQRTLMMAIHCPQLHILLDGIVPCA